MRIKFTGYMDIAKEDEPDDRGSIDNWLARLISSTATEAKETDDVFDMLQLEWEVVKEN